MYQKVKYTQTILLYMEILLGIAMRVKTGQWPISTETFNYHRGE